MAIENLVGRRLGKYDIQAEIGRGGMGTIYLGYDSLLDRQVAIKVLAPHLVFNTEFVERFLREARSAARLNHPNIVTIHDVGQEGSYYYFVMNYLAGQDLEKHARQRGQLSFDEVLSILTQVAEALDYAHHRGLVHRDVKPANIVVGASGHVTLTDFGIARATQETRLTSAGTLVGTPDYMAPEQARGLGSDYRSDLYSLGVVAYQMLSGEVPFQADSILTLLYKIVHEPPRSIRIIRPDLPIAVEQVLMKALAKDPGDRYRTAGDFVQVLQTALAGRDDQSVVAQPSGAVSAQQPTPQPVPRKPTPPPARPTPSPSPPTVAAAPTVSLAAPPAPLRKQRPAAFPWLWIAGAATALVAIILGMLLIVAMNSHSSAIVSLTATPLSVVATSAIAPTQTPQPMQPVIKLTEFSYPSGVFRIAYPSTWHPTVVSDAGSLSQAFESWEEFGVEQVWVMIAGTAEAAAQLVDKQAGHFEDQSRYVILHTNRSAGGTVLREARYTDPQHGDVHLMLVTRAQGRAVGLAVFVVTEENWADYASMAEAVLSSFTFEETAALRALATATPTVTATTTATTTATATPRPTRVPPTRTPIPPTATPVPTATEKPEKEKPGGEPPP